MTYDFLKLKVQNILQNFKNKENAARLQLSFTATKRLSVHTYIQLRTQNEYWVRFLSFTGMLQKQGSISEYNLKEATKSHIIVNYWRQQQCSYTLNRSGTHNLRMNTSTRCIAPCISNYIENEKKNPCTPLSQVHWFSIHKSD